MRRTSGSSRAWLDWVLALPLALLVFNVHVATAGDALSAMARTDRRVVYAAVLVVQALVLIVTLLRRHVDRGRNAFTTPLIGGATSLSALLFDVQDGPVRTVQLLFLLGLFAVAGAVARLATQEAQAAH